MKKLFNLTSKSNYDICIIALIWSHYRQNEFVILLSGKVKEHSFIRKNRSWQQFFKIRHSCSIYNKTKLALVTPESWCKFRVIAFLIPYSHQHLYTINAGSSSFILRKVSLQVQIQSLKGQRNTQRSQVIPHGFNTFFIPSDDVYLQT